MLWIAVWCACAAGCTEPAQRASLRVLVDADSEVRALADDVTVLVESQKSEADGWQTAIMRRYEPKIAHPWPLEITVSNVDPGATFQVSAMARDQREAVLGQVRSVRPFGDGLRLTMRVMFEASCLRRTQLCMSGETCHAGECVDARKDFKDDPSKPDARVPDGGMDPMPTTPAVVADGEACDVEGARACAGEMSRIPLRCESGMWHAEAQCTETEMCDTTASTQRGMCRAVASECLGRALNAEFCDQDRMLVCTNMFEAMVRPCVEHARCIAPAQRAVCACRSGFVDAMGLCVEATDCSVDNGGCDPLSKCTVVQGKPSCGACPPGYFGDGMTGCVAPLTGLATSEGQLTPAFDPGITDYTLKVPLLAQRVTITPSSAGAGHISFNGQDLSDSGTWTTPTLPLGEYPVELSLTAPNGAARAYKIRVQRAGKQTAYLKASNPDADDYFGMSVDMDGDTLVVGAYGEDSAAVGVNGDGNNDSARDSGAAYVFVRKNGRWEQEAYIKASDTATRDYFGVNVAISGDALVVGAFRYDILNVSAPGPGAAYVFERKQGTWRQTAVLKSSGSATGDQFGLGLAMEGATIVVGARMEAGGGAAYVFERDGEGWRQSQRLVPQKLPSDAWFGSSVAISRDTLVIGAQNDSSDVRLAGSAYVFERSNGSWNERQRLAPNPASEKASFGYSVAIDGANILVGAPRYESITTAYQTTAGEVFAYQRVGGSWQQTQVLKAMLPRGTDSFGSGVALYGSSALIGASGDRSDARGIGADASRRADLYVGAGYLFALEGQTWRQSAYLKASNAESADSFGFGVALSEHGAVLTSVWEDGAAKGVNGDDTSNSASRSGAAYVFE